MNNNSRYEIISVIGEGSYGIVYKCKAKETNEIVAIKKFKDSSDHSINKSMLRELKSLKIFSHKNIINFRESFKKQGNYYFVFDYVEKNLLEFLSLHPNGVENSLMKKIIFQICCGLRQMHKMRIAHRDIKPENILIDAKNNIKICDLGFARVLSPGGESQEGLTEYVATRWYRAPELLMGVKNYGMEIDLWSVGCIIGELIDGNPVFPGDTDLEQLYMIGKLCGKGKLHEINGNSLSKNNNCKGINNISNLNENKCNNKDNYICKNNNDESSNLFGQSLSKGLKNKKEVVDKIEKTKYVNPVNGSEILVNVSLETRYAGKVSRDTLSLIKRLLDPNPLTRIKSEDIFKHEFFSDFDLKAKEVLDMISNDDCNYSNNNSSKIKNTMIDPINHNGKASGKAKRNLNSDLSMININSPKSKNKNGFNHELELKLNNKNVNNRDPNFQNLRANSGAHFNPNYPYTNESLESEENLYAKDFKANGMPHLNKAAAIHKKDWGINSHEYSSEFQFKHEDKFDNIFNNNNNNNQDVNVLDSKIKDNKHGFGNNVTPNIIKNGEKILNKLTSPGNKYNNYFNMQSNNLNLHSKNYLSNTMTYNNTHENTSCSLSPTKNRSYANINNYLNANNNLYVTSICSGDLTTNPSSPIMELMEEAFENTVVSKPVKKKKREIIQKNFNNSILVLNSNAHNHCKSINSKYAIADKDYFLKNIISEDISTLENLNTGLNKNNINLRTDTMTNLNKSKNNNSKLIYNTYHNLNLVETNNKKLNKMNLSQIDAFQGAGSNKQDKQEKFDKDSKNMNIMSYYDADEKNDLNKYNSLKSNTEKNENGKENQYVMKGRNYKKHQFSKSLDKNIKKYKGLNRIEVFSDNQATKNCLETSAFKYKSPLNCIKIENSKDNKFQNPNEPFKTKILEKQDSNKINNKNRINSNFPINTKQISNCKPDENSHRDEDFTSENSEKNLKRNFKETLSEQSKSNFILSHFISNSKNNLGNYINDKYKLTKNLNIDLINSKNKTNKFDLPLPINSLISENNNIIEAFEESENYNDDENEVGKIKNNNYTNKNKNKKNSSSIESQHRNSLPALSLLSEAAEQFYEAKKPSEADNVKNLGFFSPQKLKSKNNLPLSNNEKNLIYEKRNMAFNKKQLEKLNIKLDNLRINYGNSNRNKNTYDLSMSRKLNALEDENENYFTEKNAKKTSIKGYGFNMNNIASNEANAGFKSKNKNYEGKNHKNNTSETQVELDLYDMKNSKSQFNGIAIDEGIETAENKFESGIFTSPEKKNTVYYNSNTVSRTNEKGRLNINLNLTNNKHFNIDYSGVKNKSNKFLKSFFENNFLNDNSDSNSNNNSNNNNNDSKNIKNIGDINKNHMGSIYHKNSYSMNATKEFLIGNDLINLNQKTLAPRKLISDKFPSLNSNSINNKDDNNFKLPKIIPKDFLK